MKAIEDYMCDCGIINIPRKYNVFFRNLITKLEFKAPTLERKYKESVTKTRIGIEDSEILFNKADSEMPVMIVISNSVLYKMLLQNLVEFISGRDTTLKLK